ncbi:coproporphyrinogen dehydrogenase HemZ [uncultured Anaerococcus sp.]|uniref:coproporphyrinogen dehydrogenase HemZ n=1 Tax=uncultured Anaerococcus sp. TaxID=293428 RepID=UPI00288A24F8|nr:coproporphyrinogen dehydrogenase HemZ [uncultured Anaerococcus sp.]
MKFYVTDSRKRKEVYDILNIFYDHEELEFDPTAKLRVEEGKIILEDRVVGYDNLKKDLYTILTEETGYKSPWGYLTGSKPSKLLQKLSHQEIQTKYLLSPAKVDLLMKVKNEQDKLTINPRGFSLYINIPFCPTRCHYCSYPTLVGNRHDKSAYVDRLIYELENINLPNKLDAIYIGGGTPSFISTKDLEKLLGAINKKFTYQEFTFEAGREDTLDFDKLQILRENMVGRISLNPQSFNKEVIERAGRTYDFDHFLEIYTKARSLGFIINMDFIVGLMGEDAGLFAKNFDLLKDLMPENITFHTLAIKVASKYFEKSLKASRKDTLAISQMIDDFVRGNSYKPYYLYRQKNIVGNLENVGYQKGATSQRYNIIINEELQSIVGLGMNANTKLINGKKYRNARNLRDYFTNLEEEITSKNKLINEYNKNN